MYPGMHHHFIKIRAGVGQVHYFFIDPAEALKKTPVVKGQEARHLLKVLRLVPGDRVGLLDGTGKGYEAEIIGPSGDGVKVAMGGPLPLPKESPLKIIVAQALLKERKMDRLIRQLTELGVYQWRPVVSERTIARLPGNRLAARIRRWEKIAVEAMKQCRRGRMPRIFAPVDLKALLNLDLNCDLKIAFWEEEGRRLSAEKEKPSGRGSRVALVLIGPEGGFSAEEMAQARARGFATAGLGPRILRAETATVAAVTLIQHLFGDMG
jgi:16S rRNA (uracil1498-N3)-methyltransferase